MGHELATKLGGVPFFETSAQSSANVESAFLNISAHLMRQAAAIAAEASDTDESNKRDEDTTIKTVFVGDSGASRHYMNIYVLF